jgi:hypothetical protein
MAQRAEITLFKPYADTTRVVYVLTVKFSIRRLLQADAACGLQDELGLISIFIAPF